MRSELADPVLGANDNAMPPLPPPSRIQELLFDAARLGRCDVIPALLQAGADIGAHDAKGYTALILACYHDRREAAALLLARGAAVDQSDGQRGNTALMGAAFKGYGEIARLLLDAGADPGALNTAGQTPLMMAALFGHCEIAALLLARGADLSAQDLAGNTAISVAAAQNNSAMVDQLTAALRSRRH